jgi:hypothetical protein
MRKVLSWLSIGFWLLAWTAQGFCQGGATGAIEGTVLDPSGAVVANAEIRIIDQDTGVLARTLRTDEGGSFRALLLAVGNYTVRVNGAGFGEGVFKDIAVRITETTRMSARVNPQTVQQNIQVEAEVSQVETTTAATGRPSIPVPFAISRSPPRISSNF